MLKSIVEENASGIKKAAVIILIIGILMAINYNGKTGIFEIAGDFAKIEQENTAVTDLNFISALSASKPQIKYNGGSNIKKNTEVNIYEYFTITKDGTESTAVSVGSKYVNIKSITKDGISIVYDKNTGKTVFSEEGIYTITFIVSDNNTQNTQKIMIQVEE